MELSSKGKAYTMMFWWGEVINLGKKRDPGKVSEVTC